MSLFSSNPGWFPKALGVKDLCKDLKAPLLSVDYTQNTQIMPPTFYPLLVPNVFLQSLPLFKILSVYLYTSLSLAPIRL